MSSDFKTADYCVWWIPACKKLSVTSYIHTVKTYEDRSSESVSEWVKIQKVDGEITALPVEREDRRVNTCACQRWPFGYWWDRLRFCGESFLLRSVSPQKRGLHSLCLRHQGSVGQMIWIFCGRAIVCVLCLKNLRKWRTPRATQMQCGIVNVIYWDVLPQQRLYALLFVY